MRVNRASWHYKIRHIGTDFGEVYNDSLCRYFWGLVFRISFGLFLSFIASFLVYAYFDSPDTLYGTLIVLFLVACVALPISAIYYKRKMFGEPPTQGIVFEYIKAKKRKICPLIEYVGNR